MGLSINHIDMKVKYDWIQYTLNTMYNRIRFKNIEKKIKEAIQIQSSDISIKELSAFEYFLKMA